MNFVGVPGYDYTPYGGWGMGDQYSGAYSQSEFDADQGKAEGSSN